MGLLTMTASLNSSVFATMNAAYAEHNDGIAPISLKYNFAKTGANLQSVAQNLTFSEPTV